MLNELLLEAGKAYWELYKTYNYVLIYEEALDLANERYSAVRAGVEYGDRPSLDTVEAGNTSSEPSYILSGSPA